MRRARVGLALLASLLPPLLSATNFIKNDLLTPQASEIIEEIGDELSSKTGIYIYALVTNEAFEERFDLVEYTKRFESKLSKPNVILIFAPNAIISKKLEYTGRVGLVPSDSEIGRLYDSDSVKNFAIDVVASKDKNSKQDKYNIGVVQSYSELADQIASSKDIEMTKSIPNDTKFLIGLLRYVIYFGSLIVLWIFILRPIVERIKNGKK
jgi:hypothetical protein